jgi:hypothetical protein
MKHIFSWIYSNLPVLLSALFLVGAGIIFSGCYSIRQGTAFLGYLNRAIPLEDLAGRAGATEEDRLFVERVESIRYFATGHLGLDGSRNYTTYVGILSSGMIGIFRESAECLTRDFLILKTHAKRAQSWKKETLMYGYAE